MADRRGDHTDDVRAVAERLRRERAQLDPMHLDQVKQRVMARAGNARRPIFMKSRLAMIVTTLALVGGSGGALAIAGVGNGQSQGGAAQGMYYPGKGCGDKNHQHQQTHGNIKPCPPQSQH